MPPVDRSRRREQEISESPSVRLVVSNDGMPSNERRYAKVLDNQKASPNVRLAHVPGAQGDNVLLGRNGVERMSDTTLPALLVSYYYLAKFEEHQRRYSYRDWVMDSGAFSAFTSGATINLQDYIDCCKRLMNSDPTLTEIYALDVIGDCEGTKKNTEEMWRQGVPAIPCFHYGEPWDVLKEYCKEYPKVAIGGCVGKRDKSKFLGQCFARQWPHKFHGFGFGHEDVILGYPLHSTDATNWELTPCGFGRWKAFGGAKVSVRGSSQNLRCEVLYYLDLEQRAREKWKKEMALLEEKFPVPQLYQGEGYNTNPQSPTVRLAESGEGGRTEAKIKALNPETDREQKVLSKERRKG